LLLHGEQACFNGTKENEDSNICSGLDANVIALVTQFNKQHVAQIHPGPLNLISVRHH
jgi:hypothetical protein